ncbi:hypothetical protein GCM10007887_43550 [Methylobacterium haplocladii]|nr:hypothetical protein GCM10007887_43550 [Methylobacterium haplocladii]
MHMLRLANYKMFFISHMSHELVDNRLTPICTQMDQIVPYFLIPKTKTYSRTRVRIVPLLR